MSIYLFNNLILVLASLVFLALKKELFYKALPDKPLRQLRQFHKSTIDN